MKKLAIIHTTPVTVDLFKALVQEEMPGVDLINFVDDSILPELAQNGGQIEAVAERWIAYATFAEKQGADCILSACSSVGELAGAAQKNIRVPVLRIDEAMAEEAIQRGNKIGVAATLSTTLAPTMKLLKEKAEEMDKQVELQPMLATEAYQLLMRGDKDGHDSVLAKELTALAEGLDVVVLAQASMARVVATLPERLQAKCLSSPRLGIKRVKQVLAAQIEQ